MLTDQLTELASKQSLFKLDSTIYYMNTSCRNSSFVISSTDFLTHMDFCQGVFRGKIVPSDSGSTITGHFRFSFSAYFVLGGSLAMIFLLCLYSVFFEQNIAAVSILLIWALLIACGFKLLFIPRVKKHQRAIAAFITEELNAQESST